MKSDHRGRRHAVRAGAAAGLVLAAIAIAGTPAAHANATRSTCTITTLTATINKTWPLGNETYVPENPVPFSGTASCLRQNAMAADVATITSTNATLRATGCGYGSTDGGSARITGTLNFVFASGMTDVRAFELWYQPDSGSNPQAGKMTVDDGEQTTVNFNFTPSFPRCSYAREVSTITFSGTFKVPAVREPQITKSFTSVSPGHPDPIAASRDGTKLYTASLGSIVSALTPGVPPSNTSPSKLWELNSTGTSILRSWTISGQNVTQAHGITGIAFDAAGIAYMTDINPPRIIKLNLSTGAQSTYATFPNLVPCTPLVTTNCSEEAIEFGDRAALPNGLTFDATGNLYVSDSTQGLIWFVPKASGTATPRVWYKHPDFRSYVGPNGLRLRTDQGSQGTIYLAYTNHHPPHSTQALQGAIYKIPVSQPNPPAGAHQRIFLSEPNENPDSFAISTNGNLYVGFAGDTQRAGFVVIRPDGTTDSKEIVRYTGPNDTLGSTAYDTVAEAAFIGNKVFFTNAGNLSLNSANFAMFEFFAGETGKPLQYPTM